MSNYLSSFVKAELIKNGEVFTVENFPIFFNSIESVSAEIKKGEIGKVTVNLTPVYEDAVNILRSGVLGFGNSKSTPDLGATQKDVKNLDGNRPAVVETNQQTNNVKKYLDNVTVLRVKFVRPLDEGLSEETPWYAVSLTQPSFEIQGSDINITLNGYSTSASFGGVDVELNIKKGATVYEIVKLLADIGNVKLAFDPDSTIEDEMRAYELKPENRRDTVFDAIKWALLKVQADFILSVNPNSANSTGDMMLIRKTTDSSKSIPKYNFIQWRNIEPEAEIKQIPVFSFNMTSGQGLFLNKMAFGVYRMGDDAFTKEVLGIEPLKVPGSLETTTTEAITMPASENIDLKLGFTVPVHSAKPEEAKATQDTALGDYAYNNQAYQEMTIDALGVPQVFPTDTVLFTIGDIKELSGKLMVTNVVHNWGAGGWTTQVTGTLTGGVGSGEPQQKAKI